MFSAYGRLTRGYGAALLLHLLLNGPTSALAQTPTFTLSESLVSTPSATSQVSADDVDIQESDGQISITFGSDWSQRIKSTVDTNCEDPRSSECQDQVKQVLGLGATAGGLQARMIPLLLLGGAALANIVAVAIMLDREKVVKVDTIHVQLTEELNEEVADWNTTSGMVLLQPLEGDSFEFDMVGFAPPTPPSSGSAPSATINEAGDLELSVGDLSQVLMDGMNSALCPRQAQGAMSVRCFANKVLRLMRLMETGGPADRVQFMDFLNLPQPLGKILEDPNGITEGPRGTVVQESYSETVKTANNLLLRPDANADTRRRIREFSNTMVFAQGVGGFSFVDGRMVVSKKFWEDQVDWEDDDEDDEEGCPTDPKKTLFCNSCGGNAVTNDPSSTQQQLGKCVGREDKQPTYEGCTCTDGKKWREDVEPEISQALQQALQPSEPAKDKNKAVVIFLDSKNRNNDQYTWAFYEVDQGQKAGCDTDWPVVFNGPEFEAPGLGPDYASGDYNMTIWGRSCEWRGNGQNPGELLCEQDRYDCAKASDDVSWIICPSADGSWTQEENIYCEFDSDGPASKAPAFSPGSCTFSMHQRFLYPKSSDSTVRMLFKGIKDAKGKDIGGKWGEGEEGNAITPNQVIQIQANKGTLSSNISITATPYDGTPAPSIDNWAKSMHFKYQYGTQEWHEYDAGDTKPFCNTKYSAVSPDGYRLDHDCTFSC